MNKSNAVAAIHVWNDGPAARERGVENYYSVSEVDADGDEIRCVGGSRKLTRAWEIGTEAAAGHGVPCVEYATEGGQETDRYVPQKDA